MKLLLDSHILVARMRDVRTPALKPAFDLIENPTVAILVSVASIWELAIKWRLDKIDLPMQPADIKPYLKTVGISLLAVSFDHVTAELDPWPPTKDPFDRLLLAQCQVENMRLVTIDRALVDHPLAARA